MPLNYYSKKSEVRFRAVFWKTALKRTSLFFEYDQRGYDKLGCCHRSQLELGSFLSTTHHADTVFRHCFYR